MSTRAVYTFVDENCRHSVYKHHDGYPSGAAEAIAALIPFARELPRFEADDAAAAFVRGSKAGPGDVRLTSGPREHGDIDYTYEIRSKGSELIVECVDPYANKTLFTGPLAEFDVFANRAEAA